MTITDCDEAAEGNLRIPTEIEGLPVTSIGGAAFSGCSSLTEITVPDSVILIEEAPQQRAEKLPSKILLMNLSYNLMRRRRGPDRIQCARMAHEAS